MGNPNTSVSLWSEKHPVTSSKLHLNLQQMTRLNAYYATKRNIPNNAY